MIVAVMSERRRAELLVASAALLFSTAGAAIKACTFSSWQVAGFRSGIAALALLLLVPASRRNWNPMTFAVAAAYAATVTLFVMANKRTTAANAIFLQSTAPLYILLLGPWLLRERLRRRDPLIMVLVSGGLILLFAGRQEPLVTAPDPETGNVLGALTGLCWAFTLVGLRWIGRRGARGSEAMISTVALGNLIAFAVAVPWALPVGGGSWRDWAVVVFLGVFQIGLAYVFLTRGLPSVPALEASILLLLEPVMNPVWALLFQGEPPGAFALAGGALIVLATLMASRAGSSQRVAGREASQ